MLKLHLHEIGATLPSEDQATVAVPGLPQGENDAWRDSSIDLQRGLEVVEVPVDIDLCEAKDGPESPVPPMP